MKAKVLLPLSAFMLGSCNYFDGFFQNSNKERMALHARLIVEQAASMTSELENSSSLYKKIWNKDFVTKLDSLPTEGKANRVPNSGFWYPEQTGGLNSTDVLQKYDQAYNGEQGSAYNWEMQNRTSRISWAGHCNGFAASAIRHREPLRSVYKNGVTFTRQDIKALMTGIHMSAGFKFLSGTRCERSLTNTAPGGALNACEDVNPGMFHTILANWVGIQKQSIIFDKSGDNQVWNYPLYAYQSWYREISASEAMSKVGGSGSTYTPNPNAAKFFDVTTNISYADAVNGYEVLDYAQEGKMGYQYVLEIDSSGNVIGGEWAVQSRTDHPDFLWIPLEPTRGSGSKDGGNPYLDPQEILQLWAESRGLTSPNQEPAPYDLFTWESGWGDFSFYKVKLDGAGNGSGFSNTGNNISIESDSTLIASGDDKLEVYVDEKVIANPKITLGSDVSFPIPLDPGITRMSLIWETATYNNRNEPHNIFYYTMD